MSVILDALQKARRDNAREGYGGYEILDSPTPHHRKRRSRFVTFFLLMTVLLVGAGVSAGFYILSVRLGGGDPFAFLKSANSKPAAGSSYSALAGVNRSPAADELPQPALISSANSRAAEAAMDELPAPVPISELAPEADSSLPPPPVGVKIEDVEPKEVKVVSTSPKKARASGGFILGSILYDEADPMAVVNGMNVREGQDYGDFKVLKIYPTKVVVQKPGEKPLSLTR